ncbi:MAG: GTP 3',8-cyclase MoaA [Fluviibacter sp.]
MLTDPHGRSFSYLRLSITDICNYRCQYCLPNGYQKNGDTHFLTALEIENLVAGLAGLGLWKVRLTGGEPTVRKDFAEIAARVSSVPGVRRVATTTNGYRLAKNARLWRDAGISAINVSVDSLNRQRFADITGHDHLHQVLDGIKAAQDAGFEKVKINTVLLRDVNDHELTDFLEWIRSEDLSIRFIELMETGSNKDYFARHHIRGEDIHNRLNALGWSELEREAGAGPAQEFAHPDYRGQIGIIAPYSKDFCNTCNRLRVTATGQLRLCLFGNGGHSLRDLLQDRNQREELQATIADLLVQKAPTHLLHFHQSGATPHLAALGG